jgi:transcriptional regulator with XRE-family HTH domain
MNVITAQRRKAGMSQYRLGKLSGISNAQICIMEQGKTANPTVETLVALARGLECDPTILFEAYVDELARPADNAMNGTLYDCAG